LSSIDTGSGDFGLTFNLGQFAGEDERIEGDVYEAAAVQFMDDLWQVSGIKILGRRGR
jgi:hypothetical protein